jgi:hypothetical protein
MKRLSPILFVFAFFAACQDPGVIAFQQGDDIRWSGLENVPPGTVTDIRMVTSLGGWDLEHMTLSPNGGLLAIGLRNNNNPAEGILDAKVLVFNMYTDTQLAEWDEQDLKNFIENNSNLTYPTELKDFNPRNLSWMNNVELLINVQPIIAGTSIESLPQDAAMVIRYQDESLTNGPDFYPRTSPSPITAPNHPQKTAFSTENRSGTIFIDGSQVNGLPTGIGKFDFVYLGR